MRVVFQYNLRLISNNRYDSPLIIINEIQLDLVLWFLEKENITEAIVVCGALFS